MHLKGPIVLTGASGFIGSRLAHWIRQNGQIPYSIDLRSWQEKGGRIHLRDFDGRVQALVEQSDCTLVHLAWCQPVRDSLQPHGEQVRLLSNLLEDYGRCFARVVALGTAEEYGEKSGRLSEEEAVCANLSPYGWGKRSAQMLVETWSRITGKPARWLRPFLVYGEGQGGNMAIPYAIRQAREQRPAMFSAGTQQRDFIHVDDVARGIGESLYVPWGGFAVANLGTGKATTLRHVLEQIAARLGTTNLFQFGVRSMRPGEPDLQIADTGAARQQFGFQAQISLDEGLQRLRLTP